MFGAITIPIEIDGYTFTKAINYNLTVIGDENKKYTWIIYADNRRPLPSEIMLTPEGARYVGIATDKDTNVYSELFTDYEWFPLNNTGDSVSSV